MQCPQCGFQEFDEHAGCAVCGFQSQAALRTGDAALKPADGNLIEFPHQKGEPERPAAPRQSPVPKVDLPLFAGLSSAPAPTKAASPAIWREELEEKLRQYRARRDGQKKGVLTDEDVSELTERFPLNKERSTALEAESVSALDAAFKIRPAATSTEAALDLPIRPTAAAEPDLLENDRSDLHSRFPHVEKPGTSQVDMLPEFQKISPTPPRVPLTEEKFEISSRQAAPHTVETPAPPAATNKSFELPESVQRIKQQRQSPRRSELFQQSLLFEGSASSHDASRESDHIILPIPAASSRDRFWAGVFDLFIILWVEVLCLLPAFAVAKFMHWSLHPAPRSLIILSAVALALALSYLLFFTALMRKTLGMNRRGLILINFTGQFPSLGETFLRTLGYLVSAGSLLLGFLWVLFDVEALAWHDRISRTYPIHMRDLKSDS